MYPDFKVIEELAPDMIDVLQSRFQILRNIYWMAPVGRRTLAIRMDLTERTLRTETDFLKEHQLIETSKSGMSLSKRGMEVFNSIEPLMGKLLGVQKKEKQLADYFGIARCIITAGDSDHEQKVIEELGRVICDALATLLPDGRNVIAVMGGTTMATVADNMVPLDKNRFNNIFVPARGGVGEALAIQANSVSALMAERTGGEHRALYVPEQVSPETYKPLLQEPAIQDVLQLIKNADCVIHSIGRAYYMAVRRKMQDREFSLLKEKKAVAESFGYFFNEDGEIVYKIPIIGIQLSELTHIPVVLAVAGGKSKAKAIHAYMKNAPQQTWLLTDEGAANEILKEESPL